MLNLFPSHKELSEEDYRELWDKGLIVFDSNVLLDLYRLPENARKDLINIFSNEKITNRIWLPFQVSLEFTYNKLDEISDQKNKFTVVRRILTDLTEQLDVLYSDLQKKMEDLQLKKRHSVINPDEYITESLFQDPTEKIRQFLEQLEKLEKAQPDVNDADDIGKRVSKLFEGKIGAPFSKADLEAIYKEGEGRYKDAIPPGYKDKNKEGILMYEDRKILRKYGDLIVWKEIIAKCKTDNLEYVILITGDVKEDWWREKRGRRLGPRYELLNEIYYEAKSLKLFQLYDTPNFMRFAKEYLKINIDQKSIEETKDLQEINTKGNYWKRLLRPSIRKAIKEASKVFPAIAVKMVGFGPQRTIIDIPSEILMKLLGEIFSNVKDHSLDHVLVINYNDVGDYIEVTFRNRLKLGVTNFKITRGKGIQTIMDIMNNYGGANVRFKKDYFILSLFFNKKLISQHLPIQ